MAAGMITISCAGATATALLERPRIVIAALKLGCMRHGPERTAHGLRRASVSAYGLPSNVELRALGHALPTAVPPVPLAVEHASLPTWRYGGGT